MLTLTDNAARAILSMVERSAFDEQAGLRFSVHPIGEDEAQLAVALAPEAVEGDEEVETAGAHVYLDDTAAVMLSDKVLDAEVTEQGEVGFSFANRLSRNGNSPDR